MRPNRFHRRNLSLCSSKRSPRPVVKWVGRIWPDLMKNPCMQSQMSVLHACALNSLMGRSARFHRRNLSLCSSKRSSRPVVKWVGRIWPDLMKNPCMQSQMPIRNACALNNCMGRSARFHRRNLMKTGSMEAPWLALHWVGMDLQSGPRSTADLRISPIACALLG
jgi:hypothetical protein